MGGGSDLFSRGRGILPPETVELGGAGWFEVKEAFFLPGQQPAQGFFVVLGRKELIFDLFTPAGGDEDKDMVGGGF